MITTEQTLTFRYPFHHALLTGDACSFLWFISSLILDHATATMGPSLVHAHRYSR